MRFCAILRGPEVLRTTLMSFAVVSATFGTAQAQATAFTRSLAEAAAPVEEVAAFYRQSGFATLWTGPGDRVRRTALITALSQAEMHGLPAARYDLAGLVEQAQAAVTEGDRGRVEVALTTAFLAYATDLNSGALQPKSVDSGIVREIVRPDPAVLLAQFATSSAPDAYLRDLAPKSPAYARLIKEKILLEAQIASGGWGAEIAAAQLQPGEGGEAVIALRNRLIVLNYLDRSASAVYDKSIQRAVQRYQLDQGLVADGVAGPGTIVALNAAPQDRLKSVVVALERLRWMGNAPLGARHIWVNLPDFTAKIVDNGTVSFQTRAVVGSNEEDRRTPEFSDQMEYMVINPSWGVPRSIIVKEYLPLLQRNANAVSHLQVIDGAGRVVPRGAVKFAAYSARSFPFGLRQPPSDGNALGKVKFMFPNIYNIYLHDTPAKSLFDKEVRAFSHGCIRLSDPRDFAHALLAVQSDDPKGVFQTNLETNKESSVALDTSVPVHLVYFTAWPSAKGAMTYRRDIYGRDGRIFDALTQAGVVLDGIQG